MKCLGARKGNKPTKRAKDTQGTKETLERIEQLLAESKRLQQQYAALSKELKELTQRIEQA